jgi:hypothetical protein
MPAALTYPGVYIQEGPSGVRTVTGVATSITAFVGRAAAGPVCTATSNDPPPMLTSFADYERRFGGLDVATPMSYAVRDFYLNGGTMALIVRVAHANATAATITLTGVGSPADDLVLQASSVGDWGNRLSAAVDYDTDLAQPHTSPPSPDLQRRFNLTVRYRTQAGKDNFATESFSSVSTVDGDPRFLPLVLERDSAYVRLRGHMPGSRPQSNVTASGSKHWVDADAHSGFDGTDINDQDVIGSAAAKTGIYALNRVDLFNLLCIPPLKRDVTSLPSIWTLPKPNVYQAALELCVEQLVRLLDRDSALGFVYSSCRYDGRLVLNHPVPRPGRIDLGQPLFRRELFDLYLGGDLPFDMMAWDWHLIDALMRHGVRWRHIDRQSFIFRLAKYPQLMTG